MTAAAGVPALAFCAGSSPSASAAVQELRARYLGVPLAEAEVAVVVGGDGAMIDTLHAILELPARSRPAVYGMHRGTVGFFMNDFVVEGLVERITAAARFTTRPLRMTARAEDGAPLPEVLACNEVALRRVAEQSARIRVSVDGVVRIDDLRGDGVLVATPVGSTAYNYSARGPILPLESDLLTVTPICPMRPRRWPGALVHHDTVVRFEVLEAAKRPVAATADQRQLVRVSSVEVVEADDECLTLLFDPDYSLDERVAREQFHP